MTFPPDKTALATLSASARRHAELFRLPLRQKLWRGLSGDFQGSGVGSSLDFQDHRGYVPGDDPRHINWQAFARTGHYTMKLYREEVRPVVDLTLDVSSSMTFLPGKLTRALELFYFAWSSALSTGASVSASVVKGGSHLRFNDDAIHSHGWAERAAKLAATGPAATPELIALPYRPQSLRILISDLLFPSAPEHLLRALVRARGRGLILAPFAREEAQPDWEGNHEFVEAESGEKQAQRIDARVLESYHTAYQRHFGGWKALSRKYDVPLARVPAEPPFQQSLQHEALAMGALELAT